jgi:phage terminase small subunit
MAKPERTPQRIKFTEVYAGNAAEAARICGFKHPEVMGPRLLKVPWIIEAIRAREVKENRVFINDRQERQKFWSKVMQDESARMEHRLKASELLGRSEGDFTDNLKVTDANLAERLKKARERRERAERENTGDAGGAGTGGGN